MQQQRRKGQICRKDQEARVKVAPKWSDVFGTRRAPASTGESKSPVEERPQELLIKAPPGYLRPAVFTAPPAMPVTNLATITSDVHPRHESGCAEPKIEEL